jgi:hypothetical protein
MRAERAARRCLVACLCAGLMWVAGSLSCAGEGRPVTGPPTPGVQYYVDSSLGDDANPGTSPAAPWRSLAPVQARSFAPGDALNFARGSLWTGGLVIADSGTADRPLTLRAYGSGPRPVFRATRAWSRAVTINASWVVLEGVRVQDAHEAGVLVTEGSQHNTIRGCEITSVGCGVDIRGEHNLVVSNWIHDLRMVVDTPGGDDDYGACGVVLYGSHNTISRNVIERCRAPSHDYGTDGGAVEIYGHVQDVDIHYNWTQGNNGFIEVGGGSAQDIRVAYNVSLNNGGFSTIHLTDRFASQVTRFHVERNVILEVDFGGVLFHFGGDPGPDAFFLRENVIGVIGYGGLADASSFERAGNLYLPVWMLLLR